jgi:His/Glu/Gln/Arg/opine family amino acid ABC transporter permease subunit
MQNLHFEKMVPYLGYFGQGFLMTLEITVVSFLISILLSILLWLHDIWVLIIRSLPLLLQLFIMAYAVPGFTGGRIKMGAVLAGIITLAFNSSAYMTESIRGGFLGVDKGQKEAAMSLGLDGLVTFFYITLPQAARHILPSMMNEIILQFKSTSMLAQIGVLELFLVCNNVAAKTFASFEPFLLVAVFYYLVVLLLNWCSVKVEGRLKRSDKN